MTSRLRRSPERNHRVRTVHQKQCLVLPPGNLRRTSNRRGSLRTRSRNPRALLQRRHPVLNTRRVDLTRTVTVRHVLMTSLLTQHQRNMWLSQRNPIPSLDWIWGGFPGARPGKRTSRTPTSLPVPPEVRSPRNRRGFPLPWTDLTRHWGNPPLQGNLQVQQGPWGRWGSTRALHMRRETGTGSRWSPLLVSVLGPVDPLLSPRRSRRRVRSGRRRREGAALRGRRRRPRRGRTPSSRVSTAPRRPGLTLQPPPQTPDPLTCQPGSTFEHTWFCPGRSSASPPPPPLFDHSHRDVRLTSVEKQIAWTKFHWKILHKFAPMELGNCSIHQN